MKKLVGFFRKIFLIDFVLGIIQSKQPPHLRFAKFLTVFSYMWLTLLATICLSIFNSISQKTNPHWVPAIAFIVVCLGFFFLYKHTSKILKEYSEEEFNSFGYLKYINPVAPVIYFTTTFLIIITIINIIMLFILAIGTLIFVLLIVCTLGLLLMDDSFKLDNFIYLPKQFFRAEDYFLENIIGPGAIIIFLICIYFLIPFFTSMLVLVQHYRKHTFKGF